MANLSTSHIHEQVSKLLNDIITRVPSGGPLLLLDIEAQSSSVVIRVKTKTEALSSITYHVNGEVRSTRGSVRLNYILGEIYRQAVEVGYQAPIHPMTMMGFPDVLLHLSLMRFSDDLIVSGDAVHVYLYKPLTYVTRDRPMIQKDFTGGNSVSRMKRAMEWVCSVKDIRLNPHLLELLNE